MDTEKYLDVISTVISFLSENEQYGDDWSYEIACLQRLASELKEGSDAHGRGDRHQHR